MKQTFKETIIDILSLCEYKGDVESFFTQFQQLNVLEAGLNLMDKQPYFIRLRMHKGNLSQEEIRKYVDEESVLQELSTVTIAALTEYFTPQLYKMTQIKKNKLMQLIQEAGNLVRAQNSPALPLQAI